MGLQVYVSNLTVVRAFFKLKIDYLSGFSYRA
jgi:hypothetical protein